MKKYIFLLFVQFIACSFYAQDLKNDSVGAIKSLPQTANETSEEEMWTAANEEYIKGRFQEAINLYEDLLQTGKESDALYYNLGNAYYKANEIAPAILNYERALLLNPGDGDIRFNLEMARLKTIDRIEPVDQFFLTEWMIGLRNIFSTNSWAIISVIAFLLLVGSLVLFFFSRRISWKKTGFYTGIIWLVIVLSGNVFSYQQKMRLTNRNIALIFVPTVTIKGSPDNSGTDIVVVHEGTKVFIKSKLGEWSEVVLENGTVGWLENRKIEII